MEKYRYSFFARIIYRYGNIIASALLSIQMIASFIGMFVKWYFVFPALINLILILLLNKFFIKTYRLFPFTIEANNEKLICYDFFFSKKKIQINHKDITAIRGGIFSNYPTRPIYITDGKQNIEIGFYSHVGNFQKLLTKILQNIPEPVYNDLMINVKNRFKKK